MRILFSTLLLCFLLTACGKKAPLEHPPQPGEDLPEKSKTLITD
ncbi:MAG: LPS translocon maturation chaperone LptM [bacterium]